MRNRGGGYRVYGPYHEPRRGRWRVILIAGDGSRSSEYYSEEAPAIARAKEVRATADADVHIRKALEEYKAHLAGTGVAEVTVNTNMHQLTSLVLPHRNEVRTLTPARAQRLYHRMVAARKPDGSPRYSVAYHRASLGAAKRFGKWLVKERLTRRNPFKEVEGVGRKNRGKPQLTADEARKLLSHVLDKAATDRGAMAVALALLLGLRAGEVGGLRVRDLDDGGNVLRVGGTKSTAARRRVRVPVVLRAPLLAICDGRGQLEPMLGLDRFGVYRRVKRLCRAAGVPEVSPHGLRGTHATLATEAGATGELLMKQLGHTSTEIAKRHYIEEGAEEGARAKTALRLLSGGRE